MLVHWGYFKVFYNQHLKPKTLQSLIVCLHFNFKNMVTKGDQGSLPSSIDSLSSLTNKIKKKIISKRTCIHNNQIKKILSNLKNELTVFQCSKVKCF